MCGSGGAVVFKQLERERERVPRRREGIGMGVTLWAGGKTQISLHTNVYVRARVHRVAPQTVSGAREPAGTIFLPHTREPL